MPTIHILPLGDYQTNTYIVHGDGNACVIIDPGFEPQTILNKVTELGLTVDAVLLTHGHFDHVGGVEQILRDTGCPLWISKSDCAGSKDAMTRYFYPLTGCDVADVFFCEDGKTIHAGGLTFTILATPGHTQGSVCYLCDDALFSGDTLFAGSCGRTDLPGGDWNTTVHSLRRLAALEGNYTVYPGHGGSTTLSRERQFNPYMR